MAGQAGNRKYVLWGQWLFVIITLFVVFIFPFILLWLMRYLLSVPGDCLVIPDELNIWFAFYGSYAGVFVTVILGIITLRLTLKLDIMNKEETELQHRMSIAMNIPNMHCVEAFLYSLNKGDLPFDCIKLFKDRNDYIFFIVMNPAFPPYFGIEISRMEISLKSPKNGRVNSQSVILSDKDYSFTNNESFKLILNVPCKMDQILGQFYIMQSVTSESTDYQLLVGDLWLDFKCQNVLLRKSDKEGDVKFRMHLQIINEGKRKIGDGIIINLINREFVRID